MSENSAKTAKKGAGKPFAKGQSGNPGGRPKLPADVKEAYRAMHPRALERLSQLVDSDDEKVALRACEIICERVEGKVAQGIEHSGSVAINVIDPYSVPVEPVSDQGQTVESP